MSKCTKTAKEEIREELLKDAAKELRDRGLTPEIAKEVLKMIEDSGLDDKDGVHIRVITIKTEKNSEEDSKEEAAKEELRKAQDETKHEPAPEKKPEAGECTLDTLVAANVRFAKAAKDMTSEYFHLSRMAADLLQENAELRGRLEKK